MKKCLILPILIKTESTRTAKMAQRNNLEYKKAPDAMENDGPAHSRGSATRGVGPRANGNSGAGNGFAGPGNGGMFDPSAHLIARPEHKHHAQYTPWTSLECRHFASKHGLNIANDNPVIYDQFYAFAIDPANREANLDAKTVPTWKELGKGDRLANFRIQALYAALMDDKVIEKDPDLDPLLKQYYQFLRSPTGLGLWGDDPNLSVFGNLANRAYCSYTYAMGLYGLREAFREIVHSKTSIYKNLEHEGLPKEAKSDIIYTTLAMNLTRQEFEIFNFNALGEGRSTITLDEVQNQILANQKNIQLTLDGKFPEDVKLSPSDVQQLERMTSFEGLDVALRDQAIAQIAQRKGLQHAETLDLLESSTSNRLTRELFTLALSKTPWGQTLTPYAAKLFYLCTSLGAMTKLPLLQYLQLISWLGDPSLSPAQTIPAPIAIDLYFQILTKNVTAQKLFRGFVSRAELDRLSERDRKSLGPVIRFNDGRVSFDEKNEYKYFHRNLVITDYDDIAEYHKLMFMYDARTGVVKEADESWKTRYVRRKTQPKPRDSRELDIDFRTILSSFHNALRPPTGSAGLTYVSNNPSAFKSLLALTTLKCLQFNMHKRVNPNSRAATVPSFDPKKGNKI